MKSVKMLLLAGGMMAGVMAAPATASPMDTPTTGATTLVNFSFDQDGASTAHGSFSYDATKTGQLSFADLNDFEFDLPDNTYNLSDIASGTLNKFLYFGWDATLNAFVTGNVTDDGQTFATIISAISNDYTAGFFVDINADIPYVYDYKANSYSYFTTISASSVTSAVPEPATWALMLVGFGMVAGAARYRRRSASVSFA